MSFPEKIIYSPSSVTLLFIHVENAKSLTPGSKFESLFIKT
ncbi:hypothetical protein OMAG_000762 [Candidatus Omnitrophus magneticus]|uniref:Uncharacterized protein n=1 Tax=Candidatus Omnitrophus magneticus TaxID=1609969 RepID=A0A0F0CPW0_9BACT|nr:hypothetical protein OMAG_000762 [Candidatus Omnitrophus magneticus]